MQDVLWKRFAEEQKKTFFSNWFKKTNKKKTSITALLGEGGRERKISNIINKTIMGHDNNHKIILFFN